MEQHVMTLYSRKRCHLCEEALEILEDLKKKWPFTIKEIDIDQSDELTEQYGLMIPVVCLDGEEIAFGKVNKLDISNRLQKKWRVYKLK